MIPPNRVNADAWNKLELAGVRSPGLCVLSGHDRSIGWDIKEASGQDGATTTLKGDPIKKFTATFTLIRSADGSRDDFAEWDDYQALIDSTVDGPKPVALDVWHPDLVRLKFRSVTLSKMGGMSVDDNGVGTIAVEFVEFNPPKPKPPASPKSSKSDPGADAFKEAAARLEAQIEEAKNESAKTPTGSGLPNWLTSWLK